jgi:hypothetical protein
MTTLRTALGLLLAVPALHAAPISVPAKPDFNRDVLPILSDNCFTCHGPDESARKARLRLDLREEALKPAKSGAVAIVPGSAAKSELLKRITTKDADDVMPPTKSGKKLTTAQVELLRRWIEQGAKFQEHWAFVKPERPPVPPVQSSKFKVQGSKSLARNPIDHFVLDRLAREGLSPSPEADRESWLRRVTFDLTGLPPTVAEIDAFLADTGALAYEKVVERLFASPRYGEHMARGWLDLARYADTHGYQMDQARTMWRWRDWVIEAFNRHLPFDQFTIEQLAGDLLPDATPDQRLATGFNRNHLITIEGGVIDEEYRTEYVMDRVTTTATTWMGLTMLCARCHDHKFDPLTMRDFYGMFAMFNQVPERGIGGFAPLLKTPTKEQERELAQLDRDLAAKQTAYDAAAKSLAPGQAKWEAAFTALRAEWQVLDATSFKSTGGATLTKQEDKSLLASGTRAAHDTYEITARTALTNISAVRLEALTHASLPNTGPGRYDNANFVLSEFELEAVSVADPKQSVKVKFASAQADYSQSKYEIALAIDGKPGTGWAVDGPVRNKDCSAWFYPDKPFGFAGGTELRFALRHDTIGGHGIGRPRLSISTSAGPQEAEIAGLAAVPREQRTAKQAERLREFFLAKHASPEVKQLTADLAALRERKKQFEAAIPSTMVMQELEKRRDTHLLIRGQYDKKGDKVEAAFPAVFAGVTISGYGTEDPSAPGSARGPRADFGGPPKSRPSDSPSDATAKKSDERGPGEPPGPAREPRALPNRLDLARWLVSPDHPLTARVAVNRIWEHHFGIGLVRTSENFGVQSAPPSHPELLDWLAVELVTGGSGVSGLGSGKQGPPNSLAPRPQTLDPIPWSLQHIHRLIVLSATYRQSSKLTPASLARDPENRLLARAPRLRLSAEAVRDNALFMSGLLVEKVGGPSVMPYQPEGLWFELNDRAGYRMDYVQGHGPDLYRRSLYTFWKRTSPPPTLNLFDAPEREFCVVRRSRTTTPMQALALLHDPTYVEAARHFAERILTQGGATTDERIVFAFRTATARKPTAAEAKVLRETYEQQLAAFRKNPEAAVKSLKVGESPRNEKLDAAEHAAWTAVARMILNLDETITKG